MPGSRVRLDLAYEGTEFSGWASQPGARTVQGVLEDALCTVARLPAITVTVAGRTDSGVHATGQVAHCDLPAVPDGLLRHLNGVLPADLRVRAVQRVPDTFDARFSALSRRYEYRIVDSPAALDPRRRRLLLEWPRPLDVAAMAAAAESLVGLHDFAAFCRRREGATSIRTLQQLRVERAGDDVVCAVVADAFCHSMVRSLVGALLAVGDGRRDPAWPASLLASRRRADEVTVAPAHGLTLVGVDYPPEDELASRAQTTRARRVELRRPDPEV